MHHLRQLNYKLLRSPVRIAQFFFKTVIDQADILKLYPQAAHRIKILFPTDSVLFQLTQKRLALIQKAGGINPFFEICQSVLLLRKYFPEQHGFSHVLQNCPLHRRQLFKYPECQAMKTEYINI